MHLKTIIFSCTTYLFYMVPNLLYINGEKQNYVFLLHDNTFESLFT